MNPTAWVISRQVGHTTAATVALDVRCATLQSDTFLGLVTCKNAYGLNDMFCLQTTQSRLLMYFKVMTMTVMVILNSCSLKENQDDRYNQNCARIRQRAMGRR
jgi:hypothetical protein